MTDRARTRQPLYRTVLSLAVAALVAAWLPFTVFYVTALHHKPAAQVSSVTYSQGQPVVTTHTSGGQAVSAATGSNGALQAPALLPVTTHAS